MYFIICEGDKAPYEFYQFSSLKQAHEAKIVNDSSIVYKELGQLEENYSKEELDAIWRSMNLSVSDPLWSFKRGFPNKKVSASKLHDYVRKEAITHQKRETVMNEAVAVENTPKVEKAPKAAPAPKSNDKDTITILVEKISGRDNSVRKKNLEMIYASKTVGEAVDAYIESGSDRKTAITFIRWAVNQKMIALGN